MKKIITSAFILFLTFTSSLSFAEEKIIWKLGTNTDFIDEVKDLNIKKENKKNGIQQLLYRANVTLDKDKVYRHVSVIWHFTDAASMQDYGTDDIYFREESEILTVIEAGSINKEGEITNFNPANHHIKNSESYNTFSSSKRVLIPFPRVEVGGVAFLEYIIEIDRAKLEGHWSYNFSPKNNFPRKMLHLSFESKNNDLSWNTSSEYVKCNELKNTLTCIGEDIPAEISNDSYRWRDEIKQLVVTEGKNWENVINLTQKAFDHSKSDTEGVTKLLEQLTKDKKGIEDKISAIHNFVINDIRYISDVKGSHSYTPHTLTETLSNRYGDCKDKSALLIELLNRIGIDAYPVLVSTTRKDPSLLNAPSMGYFNHMVACFTYEGREMCVDATDNSTDWNDISSWIQGKVSLNITKGSKPTTIPEKEFAWDMSAVTNNTIIPETDKLNEKQTRTYASQYAAFFRSKNEGKSQQEIADWMTKYYNDYASSSVKPEITVTGLDNLSSPVTMSSDTSYDIAFDKDSDLIYKDSDAWVRTNLNDYSMTNETYKSIFQGMKITSTNTFDISKKWKIAGSYPEVNIRNRFGSMTRSSNIHSHNRDKHSIKLTTTVEIPAQTISVEDKKAFNTFISLLKRESRLRIFGTRVE